MQKKQWIPEIYYEDAPEGITSSIPFIDVPEGHTMPPVLFIFESQKTGETEPGDDGEELPIVQIDLYQYANMKLLQSSLSPERFDEIRLALGLDRLEDARRKGSN
jgi:hypothetical protein